MWWDWENGVKVKIENTEKRAVVIFPKSGVKLISRTIIRVEGVKC
jgi:hypothetical protein